ncbi:RNA polymerase sigma factor [Chitinophagaceae bacterium MMS25-I14]
MSADKLYNNEEVSLAAGCRDGNAFAQKLLYERYVEQMMILCLRYISNQHDAKEALMDGFCSCYRSINSFTWQGPGSLQAWMKRVMINQCLMRLRKNKKVFAELNDIHEGMQDAVSAIDILSAKEIMQLVHQLPDGYRAVFNLYVFEEMTHKEIALLLDITENTSKSQLFKARQLLQKKICQLNKSDI